MAKPLTGKAQSFYERYKADYGDLVAAAQEAEGLAQSALAPHNFDLHLVSARAKTPDSAIRKIRSKEYGDPARQLTDQIGLRVITYFESDVDKVAAVMRDAFEIDEKRSVDKRVALGLRAFGYRSVHLCARVSNPRTTSRLGSRWFEIQVRSVLEHAWAEIEHELVYKSGIDYPEAVQRRFAALAGAAEVLDQQFLVLRDERYRLIERYRTVYAAGDEMDVNLDAARLLGLLEAVRPEGLSWRQAEETGQPFPPRIDATCVEALDACGITTGRRLVEVLSDQRFVDAAGDFASAEATSIEEISHLAVVVLVAGALDRTVFQSQFPDMQSAFDLYGSALTAAA